jgi:hypothetical protein
VMILWPSTISDEDATSPKRSLLEIFVACTCGSAWQKPSVSGAAAGFEDVRLLDQLKCRPVCFSPL